MKKEELKLYVLKEYQRDKRWCIEYHNKGEIEIYNMIFGRLQSLVGIDKEFDLKLGIYEDMLKNIPWNKKMLAGYITNVADYTTQDIDNLEKSI